MITRQLKNVILKHQKTGFINLIYGPRRVGKTVLLRQLTENISPKDLLWFNGDTQETRDALKSTSITYLSNLVRNKKVIVIDEAQRIQNIGLSLKIMIDNFPEKVFHVSGSSSLMLSRGVSEALTGRTVKYRLFPLSTVELTENLSIIEKPYILEDQLRFGGYPYLLSINSQNEKTLYLKSVAEDYLFRDVFDLENIAVPDNLRKLTTLLAYQIGSEVSLNELSRNLGIDIKTVARYINILEEGFIIFPIKAFSTNRRKEIVNSRKYYFWDLGIRNVLIDQLLPLDSRTDTGYLWENFLAVERMKKNEYARNLTEYYFWRTYEQAEIDWIETHQSLITAYEFKWQGKSTHTPKFFLDTYKSRVQYITRENYLEFIM